MDGDPAVESPLDSFSLTFPLPFRVAFIIILAVWGWTVNLYCLKFVNIDVPKLIHYPQRSSQSQPSHSLSTLRLALVLFGTFAGSICLFWVFSHRDPELVIYYDWIPMTYLVVLALMFIVPLRSIAISQAGRRRFLMALLRVGIGGLAEANNGKFGDIILADVLTSYSKVLGDLFVCVCMFFTRNGSATDRPDRRCGGTVIVPLIMAWPFIIRFRQCLIEYIRARNARGPYKESVGWGGQHLANAAKYATAFPVIVLSALLRNAQSGNKESSDPGLYRAWLAAVLLNSLYSFYWDVAKDWDLTLFSPRDRNASGQHFGLRKRLYFQPEPAIYYCVIAADLILRCTWSIKLSPHLDQLSDLEGSIFTIQVMEVVRRWAWIFFRVEAEHIRSEPTLPGVDDILLTDYQKYQDED